MKETLFFPKKARRAKKNPAFGAGFLFTHLLSRFLNDVRRLRAARPFDDLELHVLALIQGLETLVLNGREVDEYVAAIFSFNEAVPFFCAEPFDFTNPVAIPPTSK